MGTIFRSLCVLLALCASAAAASGIATVTLAHRSAEELLPQVLPFVEPGGAATGMHDKLFLRVTPANLEQLRVLIAGLDVAPRRLHIAVTSDRDVALERHGITLSAGGENVGAGGTARWVAGRSGASAALRAEVQTIDGGQATLLQGESIVLPWRQELPGPGGRFVAAGEVVREIRQGFVARPRLSGDVVTVDIAPVAEAWAGDGRPPGSVVGSRLATTVHGPLGAWLPLGGTPAQGGGRAAAAGHYHAAGGAERRAFWIKVEALP